MEDRKCFIKKLNLFKMKFLIKKFLSNHTKKIFLE
jgi:hypothetical protein